MTAKQIIETARKELGYIGKKSNAYLYDKTANITGKFTKYAAELAAAGYYNFDKNGFDWCCVFVDWLFFEAAGGDKEAADKVKPTGIYGAVVDWAFKEYKDRGMAVDVPQPGDQVFFLDKKGDMAHTGIVVEVNGDNLVTIEGNWDNQVMERQHKTTDKDVACFGRPNYAAEPEEDVIQVRPEDLDELLVQLRTIEGALSDAAEALQKASEELTKVYQEAESYAND